LSGLLLAGSVLLAATGVLHMGCYSVPASQYLEMRSKHAAGARHAPDPVRRSRPARLRAGRVSFAPETTTWKRSALTPNTSRLMVGEKEDLPLKAVRARVTIDGFRARVLLDCYYHNDRNRQLEGTFKLRLPEGASPHYLAFGDTHYRARDVAEGRQGVLLAATGNKRGPRPPADVYRVRWPNGSRVKEARMVPKEKAAHAYRQTVHGRRGLHRAGVPHLPEARPPHRHRLRRRSHRRGR
jgi:hypothetical protein